MSFSVQCPQCRTRRGIVPPFLLVCPRCDYGPGDHGPWVDDRVRDLEPEAEELIPVILTVEDVTRVIGWTTDRLEISDLLEAVAAEMRAIREGRT